jgi:hypothetical protein
VLQRADNLIADGVFRAVDPAFQSIVRVGSADLVGAEALRYVHPVYHEAMERRIELIATGVAVLPAMAKILDAYGNAIDVLLSSKVLLLDGKPASISRCRVLSTPYCDLESIQQMLETAVDLERAGQLGAAGRQLREATRLITPNAPACVALAVLDRLGAVLVRSGYPGPGLQIRRDVAELGRELGVSRPPRSGFPEPPVGQAPSLVSPGSAPSRERRQLRAHPPRSASARLLRFDPRSRPEPGPG